MALATYQDVADDIGRPISEITEITQIERWLERVEARIKQRITDFDTRITDEDGFAELVEGVEVDVVARRVNNPTGKKSERVDDYSYSLADATAKADLWPTADEWAELIPSGTSKVRSIRLVAHGDS